MTGYNDASVYVSIPVSVAALNFFLATDNIKKINK